MRKDHHLVLVAPRTQLSRRDLLGFAAKGAASVVVSQVMLGCASNGSATEERAAAPATSDPSGPSCVLTAALTEGPFFVDEKLLRSDIRSDPTTGAVSEGAPLAVAFNVSRVENGACTPLTGAYLDVWHCDAAGDYSDVRGGGAGRKFLRGYQITDASGQARFTTIYPGWYAGRAVHIHFKLRLFAGATQTYEFTSQFFFDDELTDVVHRRSPYADKGRRNQLNSTDGIYQRLSAAEKAALTLRGAPSGGDYAGVIDLGVRFG